MKRQIDFLGFKWYWIGLSTILMLACLGLVIFRGFSYGIDFAGGTEIIIKSRETRPVETLRSHLASAGFDSAVIQSYGDPAENEFLIRVQQADEGGTDAATGGTTVAARILQALREKDPAAGSEGRSFDVNAASPDEWIAFIESAAPGRGEEIAALVREHQRTHGGTFGSAQELGTIQGIPAEVAQAFAERAYAGSYVQLKADVVGPTIGKELRRRAILAIFWSLVGILAYVWFRFELNFGVGAVLCLFHDVMVACAALILFRIPLDTTVIAALLTIVGYSVNDTVVVFDRVRENLRLRRSDSYESIFNLSMNQTLGRTLLTSGLTFIVVLGLLFFGGPVIFGFALTLTIGMISGTYSTIYIASPIAIGWHQWAERFRASRRSGQKGSRRKAEKAASGP